jgi:hypothetical protein
MFGTERLNFGAESQVEHLKKLTLTPISITRDHRWQGKKKKFITG